MDEPSRATPAAAFALAVETFLAGERVDMQTLARRLGVSRTTLYRWTGQRERLLGDVIRHLAGDLRDRLYERYPDLTGVDRITAIFHDYMDAMGRSRAMRVFLQQETHFALRLLTSTAAGVQPFVVGMTERLLEEELGRGTISLRIDVPTLAYAMIRMAEGFLYNDTIIQLEPRSDRAVAILRLMLS